MQPSPSLIQRTTPAAKELLLPWLATAALLVGLDHVRPLLAQEGANMVIRMARLYFMAGFAYAAWGHMDGGIGEPLYKNYFKNSLWLALHYFVLDLGINIAGSLPAMLLMSMGPVIGALGAILLAALQHVLLAYFLAAAAGREFVQGLQGMLPLFCRTRSWALLLVLVNPGLIILGGMVLSRMAEPVRMPGAVAVAAIQNLAAMFLLMGLIRCRVDMDKQAASEQNEAKSEKEVTP